MQKIEFTKEEIKQLGYESIYHEHRIVRRRMQAWFLKSQVLFHKEIVDILDASEITLPEYLDLYMEDRVEAVKELYC